MRMFAIDPVMMKGIVAFLIPTALGFLSYLVATLTARLISPVPRHVYIARLVLLAVIVLLVFGLFYLPSAAEAFSGSRERYYELVAHGRLGIRSIGTWYGVQTVWIWFILALIKRPKKIPHDNAA
jgi:hypothetical protein